ncbi:MAG: sensor domain-containing diguanylate cyclase [Deltaproteobacteria bacterium]|nr:MAG: sensor domain-containing diguanylate cyclase [Deltaproteobacteria bacterium]
MTETGDFYKNLLNNLYDGVYFLDQNKRITFWNKGAERLTGYDGSDVVENGYSEDFLAPVNEEGANLCEKGCPAEKTISDGRIREEEVYFRHKNGHRVPVLIRVSPIRDPGGKIIGAIEIFSDNLSKVELKQHIEALRQQSLLDPLTQIVNRRGIEANLSLRLKEMQRYQWPVGILFIDIDHFKVVNDRYGHDTGDEVLQMVAETLSTNTRSFDLIGRWGGEEFIAIIINVNGQTLNSIAERYRLLVEQSKLVKVTGVISVTVSIGATLSGLDDTVKTIIRRADNLMYRCKTLGRNQVCIDIPSVKQI